MTIPLKAIAVAVHLSLTVGAMLAILFATVDMICLPDFVPTTGGGKMEGIFQTLRTAIAQPLLFFTLFIGFTLITGAVVLFPAVFKMPSTGRMVAASGVMVLLLGGIGWGVYFLPRAGCDGTWQGFRVMLQILIAVIVWFIVLLLTFRKDRRGV